MASGTSRFLVVGGGASAAPTDQDALVRDLVLGRGSSMGLGDGHYQGNKVVLVDDSPAGRRLSFRFYQVSADSGRVYSDLECSNAAPAAAVWARLHGTEPATGVDGLLPVTNLNTGQAIAVEPPGSAPWWRGDWGVRFDGLGGLGAAVIEDAEFFTLDDGDQTVGGHIVRHGNVFVLAELDPSRLDASLVARLTALGEDYQRRRGLSPTIAKVVPYRPRGVVDGVLLCDAACFSSGQRHHSLPGSAAMALGACLSAWGVARVVACGPARRGRATVRLSHPSGTMTVRVHLATTADPAAVAATSFTTPVRLLLSGAAVI